MGVVVVGICMKLYKYFVIALASCVLFTNSLDAMLAHGARIFARRAPAFTGPAARARVLSAHRARPAVPMMDTGMGVRRTMAGMGGSSYHGGCSYAANNRRHEENPERGLAIVAGALAAGTLLMLGVAWHNDERWSSSVTQEKTKELNAIIKALDLDLVKMVSGLCLDEEEDKKVADDCERKALVLHKEKKFFDAVKKHYSEKESLGENEFPLVSAFSGYEKLLKQLLAAHVLVQEILKYGTRLSGDQKAIVIDAHAAFTEDHLGVIRRAMRVIKEHNSTSTGETDYDRQMLQLEKLLDELHEGWNPVGL